MKGLGWVGRVWNGGNGTEKREGMRRGTEGMEGEDKE